MDMNEMKELAKAAAHTAVMSVGQPNEQYAVDRFLEAYDYALKRIIQKARQSQNQANMEFGSNEAKFR